MTRAGKQGSACGGVVGVDDKGVGGRDDALHEDGHAQVPEVQAHLAHGQQRTPVELSLIHAVRGRRCAVCRSWWLPPH